MSIFWLLLHLWMFPHVLMQRGKINIVRKPSNSTILVGDNHTLFCEVDGPDRPLVRWYFNNSPLTRHSHWKKMRNGNLRITHALVRHKGNYRCEVWKRRSDEHPFFRQTVFLEVQAPASIVRAPKDKHVRYGDNVTLSCGVIGFPTPQLMWLKNSIPIIDRRTQFVYSHREYRFAATESATYTCRAKNTLYQNRTRMVEKSATVTIISTRKKTGYCAPYNGTVCKEFLGNSKVFFNASSPGRMGENERIVINLLAELGNITGPFCRTPAKKLLCHYAFPNCDKSRTYPEAKPICREDCMAIKDMFCLTEWVSLIDKKQNRQFLASRGHFRLPNCSHLPSMSHGTPPPCSPADLFDMESANYTYDCYEGNGRFYVGTVNQTVSGLECQSWTSQVPHTHWRYPEIYPTLQEASNYCRNAGGEETRPWCYTQKKTLRWEWCNIPKCNHKKKDNNIKQIIKFAWTTETLVIVSSLASVTIMLTVLIAVMCCRMVAQHRRLIRYRETPQEDIDIDVSQLPQNEVYRRKMPPGLHFNELEKMEYPRNDIVYLRDIGQGAFGRVFKAKAPGFAKGHDWTVIAVKMLKEDANSEMQKDFEREASLMMKFNHPHIVKLLGVCAIGKPMCLLFEFMCHGDLTDFLRNCSPEHFIVRRRSTDLTSGDVPKLDHQEQIKVAKQIVAGMVYISEKGFVHRDLATRNCLVGEHLTVKISDFGLTRNLDSGNYYYGSEHEAIPIRWMPIESILYNRFTRESDVWSFGVVLWEIFSFALQPYYGMSHEEVVKYLKEGKVLTCPDNTPLEVYDFMRQCWQFDPLQRPTFRLLQKALQNLKLGTSKKRRKRERF